MADVLYQSVSTTPTNNKEIILAYPGKTNGLYEYHLLPRGSGWAGCISATQNVVDAFFMKNGLSIDAPGSGYVESGYSGADTYYDTKYLYGSSEKKAGLVTTAGTIICTSTVNRAFMRNSFSR